MKKSIDPPRPHQGRSRREALGLFGAGAALLVARAWRWRKSTKRTCLTEALVLRDPDIPVVGNAKGDITIVL